MAGESSTQMVRFLIRCLLNVFLSNYVGQFHSRLEKFSKNLKCSSGHIKWGFDKSAEVFPSNVQKFFAQNPKTIVNRYKF